MVWMKPQIYDQELSQPGIFEWIRNMTNKIRFYSIRYWDNLLSYTFQYTVLLSRLWPRERVWLIQIVYYNIFLSFLFIPVNPRCYVNISWWDGYPILLHKL